MKENKKNEAEKLSLFTGNNNQKFILPQLDVSLGKTYNSMDLKTLKIWGRSKLC